LGARESRAERAGPIDALGAILATGGLAAVTWALTEAPGRGLANVWVLVALALGLAGLAGFLAQERRAADPLLPLALFRSATFSGANGLTLLLYGAFGGALFLLPFDLINARHYDATRAGAALLPLSLGLTLLSPLAGRISARLGVRMMLTVGPVLVGAGFAILAATAGWADYWRGVFPGLAVLALGLGVTVAPLTDAVLGAVETRYEGAASGVNNAVARIAGLLAVALTGFLVHGGASDPAALAAGFRLGMVAAAIGCAAAGAVGALTITASKA
jgi:hypothetical protein